MRRSFALLVLVAACGGSGAADTTIPPDVEAILSASGAAMESLQSVRFEMELSGARVLIDRSAGLALQAAVGEYAAPDSAQAVLTLDSAGLTVEVGSVAIGPKRWATNPLTQVWDALPDDFGFNPAILFDPEVGWKPLLTIDLTDAEMLGIEDVAGTDAYHLRGDVQGERVEVITAGLAGEQPITVDMWVDPATGFLVRVDFTTTGEEGDTDWTIRLSDFDEPVEITPPA